MQSQTKVSSDNDMWDKTCKKWASMEKGPFHLLSSHWFTFRGLEEA